MRLAEAFLRVPDPETREALVRDKLAQGDWEEHLGRSDRTLVNLGSFALSQTKRLFAAGPEAATVQGLLARLGAPVVRQAVAAAMRLLGEQFVLGRTIEEATRRARTLEKTGFLHSYDMLGEGALTAADAARHHAAYVAAIRHLGTVAPAGPVERRPTISIKLSALFPRYEQAQAGRAAAALTDRLVDLATLARSVGIGVTVDAEEADRLDLSLTILERATGASDLAGWNGFGFAVQAYQKRARAVIGWAADLARSRRMRFMVRLVKGAYWDTEIKRAQERGTEDFPVFTRKAGTDVSYLVCARAMLDEEAFWPAFATHNALTAATILEWAGRRRDFEFQRLHGMGDGLYDRLVAEEGQSCRIYAPVGSHTDLLAYLVRRLLENGANSSFVNQIAEPSLSIDTVLTDPVETLSRAACPRHPRIALPRALYGAERANAAGLDLSDPTVLADLDRSLRRHWAERPEATALIDGQASGGPAEPVHDPSDLSRTVGTVRAATPADVARAAAVARAAQPAWDATPVAERAACLERAADRLEADRDGLMALIVREGGRTIPDALSELREAVDFCRYYAVRARGDFRDEGLPGPTGEANTLRLAGRGVFACVSPWNFPLAIFLGQVSAALVSGNAVLAKPAPQTPLTAARAAGHLLAAGVPAGVLHLLPGGPEVGAAVVAAGVDGVAFTGSTATARRIAGSLLEDERAPIRPLIAETGGLNAMIVDSTALPEQVVRDVLASGFQSAGQRCSALRLLFVQADAADRIVEMIAGAMDELVVGDPGDIATDVGPVIDRAARDRLAAHLDAHRARIVHRTPLPPAVPEGWWTAPTLIALDRAEELTAEVFGPIVHVVRFAAGDIDRVVDRINASGYGLTLGLHTRIDATVRRVAARAKVGNLYVNRSMIGAVVGVQPFGGEGLSGTGPKAGGPRYLHRFAVERTVSVDTTSAGGNANLVVMDEG
jgi:RHH-type proline utilization regulon transcriptional repressor/proline dehydrogenase/delta 1-pyrroline-5-carboxylate dehydrogenase